MLYYIVGFVLGVIVTLIFTRATSMGIVEIDLSNPIGQYAKFIFEKSPEAIVESHRVTFIVRDVSSRNKNSSFNE